MKINERQVEGVVILDFLGPLTGWKAARLVEDAMRRHGRAGTHTVVANLSHVPSVDLAGLGALVDGYSAMRQAGGEMRLAALTRRIQDLVVITRLLTVFDTFDTVEQAIQGPIPAYAVAGASPQRAPVSALSLGMIHRFLRRA